MKNLKNTTEKVKRILEEFPFTRNSDDLLYATLCREIDSKGSVMPFWYVLQHRNEFGFPSYETVGRCRRKIVEQHPELAGTDKVEGFRAANEEIFRAYARGEVV